ncbi:MAG: hypothetical protein E7652_00225 [Ruminococcaceae bacterium]|nr:hypothetical protein [Oscillospiraceae bacterium]
MRKSLGSKKDKKCYTCRFWQGTSMRVTGPQFLEYDQSEEAICNNTGFKKKAWSSCSDHEKRYDL